MDLDNLPTEDELDEKGWLELTVQKCSRLEICPKSKFCTGYSKNCSERYRRYDLPQIEEKQSPYPKN